MKRVLSFVCIASLVVSMLLGMSGCGSQSTDNAKYKIGILRYQGSSAEQEMVDGYKDTVSSHYAQGEVAYIEKNAGNNEQLNAMIQELTDEGVTAVAAFGDDAAEAAVKKNLSVPVFFVGVSNAQALGLVTKPQNPDKNATGAQIATPADQLLSESRKLIEPTSYGVIYYSASANQEVTDFVTAISRTGAKFELKGVTSSEEAVTVANELAQTQGAIILTGDSVISGALSGIVAAADAKGIPVFACREDMVANGAVLGVTISNVDLGKSVGEYTYQVLGGAKIETLPVITSASGIQTCINTAKAAALGYSIDAELLKSAKHVGQ